MEVIITLNRSEVFEVFDYQTLYHHYAISCMLFTLIRVHYWFPHSFCKAFSELPDSDLNSLFWLNANWKPISLSVTWLLVFSSWNSLRDWKWFLISPRTRIRLNVVDPKWFFTPTMLGFFLRPSLIWLWPTKANSIEWMKVKLLT